MPPSKKDDIAAEKKKKDDQQALQLAELEALKLQQQRLKAALPVAPAVTTVVEAEKDEVDAILKAYNDQFSQAGKDGKDRIYNKGYGEPTRHADGTLMLPFPSQKAANAFFTEQAKLGLKFIVVDHTHKTVMAYSDGSGMLIQNKDGKSLEAVQKEIMRDSSPSPSPSPSPK